MNSEQFITEITSISFPSVFNPYRDLCPDHDHTDSPQIRRANLRRYIDCALTCEVESVWLGRDCGYRGGRRTGIALTDEIHLPTLESHFSIGGITKATVGAAIKERTATEVWKIIREVDARVFLWNIFPFHPFEPGHAMTNRRHTAREFNQCKDLLVCLLEWFRPKRIIALGADAQNAVRKLGFSVSPVRHPSYGGHIEFADTIRKLYGVAPKARLQQDCLSFGN